MTAARQTRANIHFIKRHLRASLPHIKSSHLSEGLAAAFGHRTNASLVADLARPSGAPISPVDRHRWQRRMAELGYGDVPSEPVVGSIVSSELPDPVWGSGAAQDRATHKAWFVRCRAASLPFLYITTRRIYADVDWDCITIDPSQDHVVRKDDGGTIVKSMFETFQRVSGGKSGRPMFQGSAFVGSIKGIALPAAQTLAACYFSLLFDLSRPTS
jgi:hypothetical protein